MPNLYVDIDYCYLKFHYHNKVNSDVYFNFGEDLVDEENDFYVDFYGWTNGFQSALNIGSSYTHFFSTNPYLLSQKFYKDIEYIRVWIASTDTNYPQTRQVTLDW